MAEPTVLWIADEQPAGAVCVDALAEASGSGALRLWLHPTAGLPGTLLPRLRRALLQQARRLDAVVVDARAVDLDDGAPAEHGVAAHYRVAWLEWADRVAGPLPSLARQLRPDLPTWTPEEALVGCFDPHHNDRQAAWVRVLNGDTRLGAVVHTRLPLDPARLLAWTLGGLPGVARARGFIWTADRPEVVGELDIVGQHATLRGAGVWWASSPLRTWPRDEARLARIERHWHPDFGDRPCRVALVGDALDAQALQQQLDDVAVPAELLQDWRDCAVQPNPFDQLRGA